MRIHDNEMKLPSEESKAEVNALLHQQQQFKPKHLVGFGRGVGKVCISAKKVAQCTITHARGRKISK